MAAGNRSSSDKAAVVIRVWGDMREDAGQGARVCDAAADYQGSCGCGQNLTVDVVTGDGNSGMAGQEYEVSGDDAHRTSRATLQILHLTINSSHFALHVSHVTRNTSHVTPHSLRVTFHAQHFSHSPHLTRDT